MGMVQAWTLTAEITFYATLPLLAFVVRRAARGNPLRTHWAAVGLVTLRGSPAQWLIWGTPPTWVKVMPVYLAFFAIGMGLADRERDGHARRCGAARGWRGAPSRRDLLRRGVARLPRRHGRHRDHRWPGHQVQRRIRRGSSLTRFSLQWVVAAGLLLPAVLGLQYGGRWRSFFSCRVALFLGSISYAIYLWHWAIIRWLAGNWFNATSGQTMLKVAAVGLPGHDRGRLSVVASDRATGDPAQPQSVLATGVLDPRLSGV